MSSIQSIDAATVEPGIYTDIGINTYHASPGISASGIKLLARSPAHYRYGQRKDSPALMMGRVIDCAVLEPHLFELQYAQAPDCRRGTKEWQAAEEAANGKELLKPDEWKTANEIRDAVFRHPTIEKLLDGTQTIQESAYWIDPATGLLCKCRPDASRKDWRCLIDLKSTQDARAWPFSGDIKRYGYHMQASWYLDGYSIASGEQYEDFVFIALEKEPPYALMVYDLDKASIDQARREIESLMRTYQVCMERNEWPAYPAHLTPISLPKWAFGE